MCTNIPQDVDLEVSPLTHSQALAFYSKIERADGPLPTKCHLWTGSQYANDYGQFMQTFSDVEGKKRKGWKAHRLAWILAKGSIPEGQVLDHLCGVRHCCNPEHLRLCTQAENARRRPGLLLNMEKAQEIRVLKSIGWRVSELAERFQVRRHLIYAVLAGSTWKPANDNLETVLGFQAANDNSDFDEMFLLSSAKAE